MQCQAFLPYNTLFNQGSLIPKDQVFGFIWHCLESRHTIIGQVVPVYFLSHIDMFLAQPFQCVDSPLPTLFIHTRNRQIQRLRRRTIPEGQT